MDEVRFKVSFGRPRRAPISYGPISGHPSVEAVPAATRAAESQHRRPVSRIARLLALAYFVEQQVETGVIKDYAEAARILGMSRGRMTQVINLLSLPVTTQEGILLGQAISSERRLRNSSWA